MHQIVFYLATIWIIILVGVSAVWIIRARSPSDRILALDTLTLILIALLALFAHVHRSPYYLDAALTLALLAFIGTLAAARYYSQGKVF